MYKISISREKNRLYVRLGTIDTGEGQEFFDEIQVLVARLSPGFTAVSDIREFSLNDPEEGQWAEKILPFIADAGMSVVARVTGGETSTRERRDPKLGYRIVMVDHFDNADEVLDNLDT